MQVSFGARAIVNTQPGGVVDLQQMASTPTGAVDFAGDDFILPASGRYHIDAAVPLALDNPTASSARLECSLSAVEQTDGGGISAIGFMGEERFELPAGVTDHQVVLTGVTTTKPQPGGRRVSLFVFCGGVPTGSPPGDVSSQQVAGNPFSESYFHATMARLNE